MFVFIQLFTFLKVSCSIDKNVVRKNVVRKEIAVPGKREGGLEGEKSKIYFLSVCWVWQRHFFWHINYSAKNGALFKVGHTNESSRQTRESYWRGRISTINPLAPTCSYRVLFILNFFSFFTKQPIYRRGLVTLCLPLKWAFYGIKFELF
jgi:hypothetical protein